MFKLKRIYEEAAADDGLRVLVDRLWPRGMSKEKAEVDLWLKDIAPSPGLRQWFAHDPARWEEFRRRYEGELYLKGDLLAILRQKAKEETVTLLYAARDENYNHVVVLKKFLENANKKPGKPGSR
ncbi:DUF488 domain-containing protein [Neomoorella thermoacetica]|uniref:Uroporphyrin-III C-methyltransferase n=1 Tax=Moorella thermoacetica (strain ATCC 39073 / JCM 9320) TaxID=264732 RepID=Q2RH91_MOOTA|nr:DUF488 domain-containing protein [Moorella thermoacetica]AKX94719.1 hypothetical protein MOTHE_c19360 [Moorella thermoacetica]AKX97350.1 hypothetical protein MOTHA_c20140 [Moorella thermoacetica]OIQ12366.1 hypothetical protein MOOTH_06940 [Moorella thermoacetica]OIQ53071.1 hypothetical protein MORE_23150 [Moorella thermoacetica]OIQ57231.1 hypothetical protein MOCA_08110 [Moorella thermoacetica]